MPLRGPQCHPDVVMRPRDGAVMAINAAGDAVRLNLLQAYIVEQCDGNRTIDEVTDRCCEHFEQDIPTTSIARFVERARGLRLLSLRTTGLLDVERAVKLCPSVRRKLVAVGLPPRGEGRRAELGARVLAQLAASDPEAALATAYELADAGGDLPWVQAMVKAVEKLGEAPAMENTSRLMLCWPLMDPLQMLRGLDAWFGWMFGPIGALLYLAFVAGGVYLTKQLRLPHTLLDPTAAATFYVAWCVSVPVHELAHALTCVHFGGPVRRMGVGLMGGVLIFAYADVTASYLFPEKWKRLMVIASGLMATAWFGALCGYLCTFLPAGSVRDGLTFFLLASGVSYMMNLAPFLKLDGYYLLSETLEIPNMMGRAYETLGRRLHRWFIAGRTAAAEPPDPQAWKLLVFAISSLVYGGGVFVYATAALYEKLVSTWRGYGFAALVSGLAAIVGPTITRHVARGLRFVQRFSRVSAMPVRLRVAAAVVVVAALLSFVISLPVSVQAPFVILPTQRAEVRSTVTGTLAEVFVHRGERVQAGQPVARLEAPELVMERAWSAADLERARAAQRVCMAGPRPQEIAIARADEALASAQARAARERARRRWRLADLGLLARAESADAQGAAISAVASSDEEYDRLRLVTAGCRREQMQAAAARVEQAAAALGAAEERLAALVLRAPRGGTLDAPRPLGEQLGAELRAGDALASIFSDAGLVAELSPAWIPPGLVPEQADVKLVLPDGRALYTRVRRVLPQGAEGTLRLRTSTLGERPLLAGISGAGVLYGPTTPLAVKYVVQPVQRWVRGDLWVFF